jgi:hypothetical protein
VHFACWAQHQPGARHHLARRAVSLARPAAAQPADRERQTAVLVRPEGQQAVRPVQQAEVRAPERQAASWDGLEQQVAGPARLAVQRAEWFAQPAAARPVGLGLQAAVPVWPEAQREARSVQRVGPAAARARERRAAA